MYELSACRLRYLTLSACNKLSLCLLHVLFSCALQLNTDAVTIKTWKQRTSLDALVADDRDDVWRLRLNLSKSLTGVRLIKSIAVTVAQTLL